MCFSLALLKTEIPSSEVAQKVAQKQNVNAQRRAAKDARAKTENTIGASAEAKVRPHHLVRNHMRNRFQKD